MSELRRSYGSWPSALTARELAASVCRYGHIQSDHSGFYWLQSDPAQGGRQTICRYQSGNGTTDIIPPEFNVRSRVHEYGGGDFSVLNGQVIFCNDADQRLYHLSETGKITALTPEPRQRHGIRYADMNWHPEGRWIVCVREQHPEDHNPEQVINDLVLIDLTAEPAVRSIVSGADFYANPRFSPDGSQLAWIDWNHPDMPWDNTSLCMANFGSDGELQDLQECMNEVNESIYQPDWCPDGELHFVSDRSNWWNIYSLRDDVLNALTPMEAEFGFPQWQFGIRSYQFIDTDTLAAIYTSEGYEHLCLISLPTGTITSLNLPFCAYPSGIQCLNGSLYFIAASERSRTAVYRYELSSRQYHLIAGQPAPFDEHISVAEPVQFKTSDNDIAHAFFYAPSFADCEGEQGELPPAIVMSHGGPTGQSGPAYNLAVQFWTQRGFAVIDVNYRGSTGFGREYRNRLVKQWGVRDVEDCIAATDYLINEHLIDPDRLAIRGGSAGGFTVFRALQKSEQFSAGVSRYGVADLISLAKDTHKFELRYMDNLIGRLPEEQAVYEQRSPINHVDEMRCATLLLQGDEDPVVPPSQSIQMAKQLDENRIPHQLVLLPGEQHGFRRSENICKALELELNFYRQVFDIKAEESLTPLDLKHHRSS